MSAEGTSPAPAAAPQQQQQQQQAASSPAQTAGQTAPAQQSGQTGASLYVGELDPSVAEAQLFEIFNMIGPVASIRVCRDAVTRRSLGYAYVNFLNTADGERALEHLNYSLIKEKPCRIMWSQRDPALRKTGQGNIFIKNLDDAIDNKALHDTFAAFGDILSCKVGRDENGKSRGFAFVHYSTGEAADAAINAVNGMLLNDKKVFVGHHVSKKERMSKIEEQRAQFTNVFVKNLDAEVTDEEFEGLFKPFGDIVSAAVGRDEQGVNKGFGFVNFTSHEAAQTAVDKLNDTDFKGKKLFVGRAQKRSERDEQLRKDHEDKRVEQEAKSAGVNLYVKNLDDEWDDERLRAEFDSFGTITSCKVMKDDKGASKNFGFVCFSAPEEATKAVSEMNGKMIGTKPLYVALAQRKDVRRQALESQMAHRATRGMPFMNGGMAPGAYMGNPMYGYPPMPGYQQPGMMPMRGGAPPMMGYPGGPGMMQARPRYSGPGGQGGMPPMPYGMGPGQMGPYPGMPPNYAARPNGSMGGPRPSNASANGPRNGGGPSPVNLPQGLPAGVARGQMPSRPQQNAQAGGQDQAPTLNATALARAAPADQKQMLGEALYPLIAEHQPERAGKITGMLLEMDNGELLHLIENAAALQDKVDEAIRVLEEWGQKSADTEETTPAPAAASEEDKAEGAAAETKEDATEVKAEKAE